jgi:hypothetical protein
MIKGLRRKGLVFLSVLACAATLSGSVVGEERRPVPDRLAREAGLTVARIVGAAEDFARHCQGCHGHHGVSVAEVPALKDRIGLFVHTPEGRAYLPRVPGVAFAHLSDAELAAVLNWTLRTYSAEELPDKFTPYTASEVGTLRRAPVNDIEEERGVVIEGLVGAGVVTDTAILGFGSDRRY